MNETVSRPYLTDSEIKEIVAPLTQPAAIMRWFKNNGYTVKARPNGMPLIARANFELVSGGTTEPVISSGQQPDVSGYLKHIANKSKKGAVA